MRFTGKLHTWNEDRGFGFIRPDAGGQDIFVHVSALPTPRPQPDEVLTFEVGLNRDGKKKALEVRRQQVEAAGLVADAERSRRPLKPRVAGPSAGGAGKVLQGVIVLVIIGVVGTVAYRQFQKVSDWKPIASPDPVPTQRSAPVLTSFQCDGRQHCSQMTSCEEAVFFNKNCPGSKMDGDGDGEPCERGPC